MTCRELAEEIAAVVLTLDAQGAPEGILVAGGIHRQTLDAGVYAGLFLRAGNWILLPGPAFAVTRRELEAAVAAGKAQARP